MTLLTRPLEDYLSLSNGTYDGEIEAAAIEKEKDFFSKAGSDRDVLVLKIKVFGEDKAIVLRYAPTISWSPKSNLFKVLVALAVMPEKGQQLDINNLVGKKCTVHIVNETKDGITYCNIRGILPARVTRAIAPVVAAAIDDSNEDDDDELNYED